MERSFHHPHEFSGRLCLPRTYLPSVQSPLSAISKKFILAPSHLLNRTRTEKKSVDIPKYLLSTLDTRDIDTRTSLVVPAEVNISNHLSSTLQPRIYTASCPDHTFSISLAILQILVETSLWTKHNCARDQWKLNYHETLGQGHFGFHLQIHHPGVVRSQSLVVARVCVEHTDSIPGHDN